MNAIVHGTGGAGKVKNVIHFPAVKRLINVDLPKFKASFVAEMIEIGLSARQKVIHRSYGIAFRQQGIAEMRAQEAGPASDQGALCAHDLSSFLDGVAASAGPASGMAGWRPTL